MTEYSVADIKKKIKNKNFVICKIKEEEKLEKHENMMMSEVEVDEFMNSVLEEEDDIDGQEKNIMEGEDEFLALLERDDNVMKNGISKNVEGDHHEINRINLDEFEFL
ncbi:uncharacterized protein LOC129884038 [Solanum dulcamara]|uniref:uncharacterized protein LOC129884038 n=1 Tax=Solanum dulcamara TaxID=45834 RepID=UPI0024863811|nr:uncharacterized protein LOC129884038 [Solanum dulcamara]